MTGNFNQILTIFFGFLAALGVSAWIVYYFGRIFGKLWYFPSEKISYEVHNNLPIWFRNSLKLFKKPENLSVAGFLSVFIWPFIVLLNLFLIAQIFELFISAGKRIHLKWVGVYSFIPLVIGALWAIGQVVLGIAHEKSKDKNIKLSLFLTMSATIVAESGLAAYRSYIIIGGDMPISPTIFDNIFYSSGIIFSAFIGFVIPIIEIVLGKTAFCSFIEPMIDSMVKWSRGLVGLIFCILSWFIFGFHSIAPVEKKGIEIEPSWLSESKKKIKKLKKETINLEFESEKVKKLYQKINDYLKNIISFDSFKSEFEKINHKKEEKKAEIENYVNNYSEISQNNIKKKEIVTREEIEKIKRETYGLTSRFRSSTRKAKKIDVIKRNISTFLNKLSIEQTNLSQRIMDLKSFIENKRQNFEKNGVTEDSKAELKLIEIFREINFLDLKMKSLKNLYLDIKNNIEKIKIYEDFSYENVNNFKERTIKMLIEINHFERYIALEFKNLLKRKKRGIWRRLIFYLKNLIFGTQNYSLPDGNKKKGD